MNTYTCISPLPIPTSLSKHLPLRFRFIHPRVDGREIDSDRYGIYRIVQVPLNYSLVHLRKLIEYVSILRWMPRSSSHIISDGRLVICRLPAREMKASWIGKFGSSSLRDTAENQRWGAGTNQDGTDTGHGIYRGRLPSLS
ncbi:hypothetical protein OG21DRAFT_169010 [Imleria badia]|nr:hypothetical protein OG21DRAFT_169010 [Imleria badia]